MLTLLLWLSFVYDQRLAIFGRQLVVHDLMPVGASRAEKAISRGKMAVGIVYRQGSSKGFDSNKFLNQDSGFEWSRTLLKTLFTGCIKYSMTSAVWFN